MSAIKVGASRQVAIPKKLHDELGLSPGDYLEIERKGNQLVLTPKSLVEKRLAEALEDVKKGRLGGPYKSVDDLISSLHGTHLKRKAKSSKRRA